jgi:hypothetical protein
LVVLPDSCTGLAYTCCAETCLLSVGVRVTIKSGTRPGPSWLSYNALMGGIHRTCARHPVERMRPLYPADMAGFLQAGCCLFVPAFECRVVPDQWPGPSHESRGSLTLLPGRLSLMAHHILGSAKQEGYDG